MDACTLAPPDVAADVSSNQSNQIVQLLNSGIWVFNKQGQVQGTPETLSNFWFTLSPQPKLTDTQVAYDPFAQRWLVSTLSLPTNLSNGDLFFAFSQSSDATMGWNFYKISNVCSSVDSAHPAPDMPIMGYNQTWVAIALRCSPAGGGTAGTDQIVLIPSSVLTKSPAPQTLGQTQKANAFFNARPSRDISGGANQPIFLVAPEVTASKPPFVQVTSIDASGNYVGPGPSTVNNGTITSPTNGVLGTAGLFTLAQHDTCGAGTACEVSLQDDRIASVIVQSGNDGKHYLLTSFQAGDSTNNTVQALYFVGQIESFPTDPNGVGQWNGWYIDGPNFWAGYPTITMDNDLDIASTFQTFALNSNIYPNWYLDKGFIPNNNSFAQNPPSLGYGILGNASRSSYYGDTNCLESSPQQRWGDYMSTIWDPNLGSPNEGSGFWTVQEYSNGGPSASPTPLGSNESTQITELAEPLPYFVGYSVPVSTEDGTVGEDECSNGSGFNCNLAYTAPAGSQFGDVFVATIYIGEATDPSRLTLPTGWIALKDQFGTRGLVSSDAIGSDTSFVALYVYGSQPNDTGTYKLKIDPKTNGSEVIGFMVAYRGASANIPGNYVLNGNPGSGSGNIVTTNKLSPNNNNSPAGESTLLYLFDEDCLTTGAEDPDAYPSFSSPSGPSHKLTSETPFTSRSGIFAADVGVPTSGGTYGPYNEGLNCQSLSFSYSLVIPEN